MDNKSFSSLLTSKSTIRSSRADTQDKPEPLVAAMVKSLDDRNLDRNQTIGDGDGDGGSCMQEVSSLEHLGNGKFDGLCINIVSRQTCCPMENEEQSAAHDGKAGVELDSNGPNRESVVMRSPSIVETQKDVVRDERCTQAQVKDSMIKNQ
ncbi:hypothetical protein Ancab_019090 [Ancistrocladus abbreviatus]